MKTTFEEKMIHLTGSEEDLKIVTAHCIGDFGYHETPVNARKGYVHCRHKGFPATRKADIEYTVTHIPSGLYVKNALSISDAKKLTKAVSVFSGENGWDGKGIAKEE